MSDSKNYVLPSNKSFGLFFSVIFLIIALILNYYLYENLFIIFIGLSIISFLLAIFFPASLLIFNKLWLKFGLLLGSVISPIVLGIIFYLLVSPISLVTRLFGRDTLRLNQHNTDTYWITREGINNKVTNFKRQF
jgi:hypothetical protein